MVMVKLVNKVPADEVRPYSGKNHLCQIPDGRYNKRGSIADLEEAIRLGHASLELCPLDHSDRAVTLYSLGHYLRSRFQKDGGYLGILRVQEN